MRAYPWARAPAKVEDRSGASSLTSRLLVPRPTSNEPVSDGLALQEVSTAAGMTLYRGSLAERHPDRAKPGELAALRAAVDRLARRRGRGPRFVKLPGAKRPGRGRAGRVIYREANLRPNLGALIVPLPVPCHHRIQRRKDDRRRRFCEIRDRRSPVEFCKGVVLHLMQSAMAMGGFWVSVRLSDMLLPSEGP